MFRRPLYINLIIFWAFLIFAIPMATHITLAQQETAQDATAHYYCGKELDKQGKYDEALSEFQKALEIDPNFGKAHLMLGVEYLNRKRYDDAILELKKSIDLGMDNVNMSVAHYDLGVAYLAKGLRKEAELEFKIALQINPNFREPKIILRKMKNLNLPPLISIYERTLYLILFLFIFLFPLGISIFMNKKRAYALNRLKNYFNGTVKGGILSHPEFKGEFQGRVFDINLSANGKSVLEIVFYIDIGFSLNIEKEDIVGKIGKKIGFVHEVKIYDPQFDAKYLIISDEPAKAISFLQNPSVRNAIDNISAQGFKSLSATPGMVKIQKIKISIKQDLKPENITNILQNLALLVGGKSFVEKEANIYGKIADVAPKFNKKKPLVEKIIGISSAITGITLIISSGVIFLASIIEPPNWLKMLSLFI